MTFEDVCISCGRGLASWERNRAECLDCREIACETYSDDHGDGTTEDYAS
ncbi:hypothetical protein [Aneurinibacillus migulanus]|jgi:hypothetical protein|nr:hypothetical protein [Aneurinibacillus migulanus]MCP1357879.1 hypothetical protein [Aneurinibacillus migulanus]MED0894553.1 hypothetical protein [Aneurinibacillus migulanus]MED1616249.1 hypothetical protein [Aneurinibacillus migulanus]MED4731517.1 hypothetical protein [Aneurinibacillus migulanus]GED16108.1 hypothetical protein AMI01nite_40990 [Aneurinibacillus migulanus]